MAELQINTTQNVNINFTTASVGERILAYGIDIVIKIAYAVIIFQLVFKLLGVNEWLEDYDMWSQIAIVVLFLLPTFFYSLLLEALLDGQTIGKRLLKIKVVKIDGYQASFADYVTRWFFRIIDTNMLSGVIALIMIVSNSKNQRIGDIAAGTAVISIKNRITIDHTILENISEDYVPAYPSVIRLSDNDARIIKETFITAKKTRDHATLLKLKAKIEEVTGTKSVHNDTHSYIDKILKDYNYYTQNM